MSGEKPELLEYASEGRLDAAQWRLRPRFPRIPRVVIAVAALLVFHLAFYMGWDDWMFRWLPANRFIPYTILAAFMPVLVQKRDWRSLGVGAGALAGLLILYELTYRWSIYWQVQEGGLLALVVFLAAYAWLGHGFFKRGGVLRVCLLAAAAAAVMPGAEDFWWAVAGNSLYSSIYFNTRGGTEVPMPELILPYLFVVALWIGVAWMGRKREAGHRVRSSIAYVSMALPLVVALAYFGFGRVWLADRSLRTGYPFNFEMSLGILIQHGIPDARLWEVVEHANWNPPVAEEMGGWRLGLVNYLAGREASAPARLASLLLRHPRQGLADAGAKIFVKSGRYEVIPVLLRYALADHDDTCAEALGEMGVRQAAWPIVLNNLYYAGEIGEVVPELMPRDRARLAALLGSDAGTNPFAWFDLLDAKANGARTGIPVAVTEEADQVLGIFDRYWKARADLRGREHHRAGKLAAEAHLSAEFQNFLALQEKYPLMPVHDLTQGNERLFQLTVQARDEAKVADPDWNVVGTAALGREVTRFEERVERLPGGHASNVP